MLTPPTFIVNMMAVAHPYMYATNLAAAKESWSLYVTTKCVTNSYNLLNDPSPQKMYAPNPSSTRDVTYQRGIFVRGVKNLILRVT